MLEEIAYGGWERNLRLTNGDVELLATLDVGPRILRYHYSGGFNVLKEFNEQLGGKGESDWCIRGGHRLWIAPEDLTRTYALDNVPLRYSRLGPLAARLTPPVDQPYGIQKELDVQLAPKGSQVTLTHRVTNVGAAPTELAVWAPTVLTTGGLAIIPLPPKRPHPGHVRNATSPNDFAPNQRLVLWPFLDLSDPRWTWGSRFILARQDTTRSATKLGVAHTLGWIAYLVEGNLFVKRFSWQEGRVHPDGGVNFELFTNETTMECESLGPLVLLAPGLTVEHVERWELYRDVPLTADERDEAKIAEVLAGLGLC